MIAGAFGNFVQQIHFTDFVQAQQIAQHIHLPFGIGQPLGDQIDTKIGLVRGEGGAIAIEDPATPRRDQRQVDPVALALGGVFLVLGNSNIAHAHGQQCADACAHAAEYETATVETVFQRRPGNDLVRFLAKHQPSTLTRSRRRRSSPPIMRAMTGKARIDSTACGPNDKIAITLTEAPENNAEPSR